MEPEGRIVDRRRGFYIGLREVVLLFVLLVGVYYIYLFLAERGFDLSKVTYRTMIVIGNNVNLRAGPGRRFPTINRLPKGSRVIYLNEYRDINGEIWAKIRGYGNDGWVNRIYLN
jgi:hypothetical protein